MKDEELFALCRDFHTSFREKPIAWGEFWSIFAVGD